MTKLRFFAFLALSVIAVGVLAQTAPKKVVIGKLGQALHGASIHASASSRARVYYRVKPYEYLVLRTSSKAEWYRVLLQNGNFGYIKSELVASLPWDVTMDAEPTTESRPNATVASRGNEARAAAADWGLQFAGKPYKWGGNDPLNGIDCSGFVKYLYGGIGLELPRTAAQQALVGQPILRFEDLQPGDRLYFWDRRRGKIGHTGLYLGNAYFVHSSAGKGGVSTDYLTAKWQKLLVAARR
jgi:cell wall-associated NlpC family hydrolase